MKRKTNLKSKILTLDLEKIYKNDFNLMKIIAQTKKTRYNNKTLEARKNNLQELMMEINEEYQLNKNPSRKNLQESNKNFQNEYELFKKRVKRKETKEIFKDLVKLYKSKGYRIPNFSIDTHNLFKINPLLEANTDMILNGFLETQINNKKDDSEKVLNYLKKLGIILSQNISTDPSLQKSMMNKFKLPKHKITSNEEDEIENLKKKIEIITNLIKTNALSNLEETKKKRIKSMSRQNTYASAHNSNKQLFLLNKEKNKMARRMSINDNRIFKFFERRNSNESSNSNISIASNNNNNNINFINKLSNKDKSSESLQKIFNYTHSYPITTFSKTPKTINIPVINMDKINPKRDSTDSNISLVEKQQTFKIMNSLSAKQNNLFINKINRSKTINKKIFNFKSQTNNNIYLKNNSRRTSKNKNNNYPFFIKTQSNNESNNSFSDELLFDSKSPRDGSKFNNSKKDKKKNDSNHFPYTSRNEFINFAFNKFRRKNIQNSEKYIINYLSKVKGYDKEKIELFINDIYDRNIKNNIKDLEKQITDKDLYYKTERLYLNSQLIKKVKPLLNSMGERDKMIYRLEKNLADAVGAK